MTASRDRYEKLSIDQLKEHMRAVGKLASTWSVSHPCDREYEAVMHAELNELLSELQRRRELTP